MNSRDATVALVLVFAVYLFYALPASSQQVTLVDRAPDPHGAPRPARGAQNVPLRTSLYFELELPKTERTSEVDPESVAVNLVADGRAAVELLGQGRKFGQSVTGWLRPKQDLGGNKALAVYLEPGAALEPRKSYTVRVAAGLRGKPAVTAEAGTWEFSTEAPAAVHAARFAIDLKREPVMWHGQFFSGICNVIFCTDAAGHGPTYELMAAARKQHPRAWSLERHFWLSGTEDRPRPFLPVNLPNIVRERETRRIAKLEEQEGSVVLHLDDFVGHEQYGIAAGRPVGDDYHAGDEVLIADGLHHARTHVIAADSAARTVKVAAIAAPAGGWKIAYDGPLPQRENPDAPGLFPAGGCYSRKLKPHGTACYYWGRLDKEWDLAVRHYGRRVVANFADAPADLARDGQSWTTVKDYAQWHDVARTITGHIIDRYGADALQFTWSIFNEPDLGGLFWRADWNELQTYYDYTTDAILRAFEDRGFDSNKVFIGGLELGGIFGTNLKLEEFLAHCSPTAHAQGALPKNAAVADARLGGRRSHRVETLCRDHAGKGSPCDFISIHSYNRAQMMAAKLKKAKEVALAIDPAYYRALWVNSHEACPDWMPPPDEAAGDSYMGNGYFATWCLDVARRQLDQAARDPRYAYGETILTVWPPPRNFAGINAVTRVIQVDDNGDGRSDRTVTVPMPIFHVLGLLSDLGDRYWALPEQIVGGHAVSGFASRDAKGDVRVLFYSHHPQDTQSRSEAEFDVRLALDGLDWDGPARVTEYRFDRDHNSPFRQARALRDRAAGKESIDFVLATTAYSPAEVERFRMQCESRASEPPARVRAVASRLELTTRVAGNGCVFLTIEPAS
jgi:Glycosyl hydrolases family 39